MRDGGKITTHPLGANKISYNIEDLKELKISEIKY